MSVGVFRLPLTPERRGSPPLSPSPGLGGGPGAERSAGAPRGAGDGPVGAGSVQVEPSGESRPLGRMVGGLGRGARGHQGLGATAARPLRARRRRLSSLPRPAPGHGSPRAAGDRPGGEADGARASIAWGLTSPRSRGNGRRRSPAREATRPSGT